MDDNRCVKNKMEYLAGLMQVIEDISRHGGDRCAVN